MTARVITQPVKLVSNNRTFEAVGTGRARLSIGIYPAVSEEVTHVYFDAQQQVSEGETLVQLDDREEKLAVQLAEIQLKDAKTLLDRYTNAGKAGAVPDSEVDTARADYEAAEVALGQARLAQQERQIKAPFAGVVGIPTIDAGDRVAPDTFITGLDDRDLLYIDFAVPEALAGALLNAQKEMQEITVATPAYPGQIFTGHIIAQESRINPQQRTLMARASVVNADDILRPGMSFAINWEISGQKYPAAPEISLQWGREGSYIWLIRGKKSEKIYARVVARKGGYVLLDGEIEQGDNVVVEGLQRLRPGAEVKILGADDEAGRE